MNTHMLGPIGDQLEIAFGIIQSVSIFMVNYFDLRERSANNFLHNKIRSFDIIPTSPHVTRSVNPKITTFDLGTFKVRMVGAFFNFPVWEFLALMHRRFTGSKSMWRWFTTRFERMNGGILFERLADSLFGFLCVPKPLPLTLHAVIFNTTAARASRWEVEED